MAASTQVRLHPITKQYLDGKAKKINAARKKLGKKPMTMDDIINMALAQLNVEDGASK